MANLRGIREGIVLEVLDEGFLARLVDLTQKGVDEEAEFSLYDIAEDDKPLIKPGAIFYWDISHDTNDSDHRTRISHIHFRRLPEWSHQEIEEARREADRLGKVLGWQS
jgi:hypothetical protein